MYVRINQVKFPNKMAKEAVQKQLKVHYQILEKLEELQDLL